MVALGEGGCGDGVGDVDDGALEDLVESVALGEPCSAVSAELAEGCAFDEGEGLFEVLDACWSAGLGSCSEAAEEVCVYL